MCEKSPSYTSKKAARLACRKMGNSFRAYWCPDHHGWHVSKTRTMK